MEKTGAVISLLTAPRSTTLWFPLIPAQDAPTAVTGYNGDGAEGEARGGKRLTGEVEIPDAVIYGRWVAIHEYLRSSMHR